MMAVKKMMMLMMMIMMMMMIKMMMMMTTIMIITKDAIDAVAWTIRSKISVTLGDVPAATQNLQLRIKIT